MRPRRRARGRGRGDPEVVGHAPEVAAHDGVVLGDEAAAMRGGGRGEGGRGGGGEGHAHRTWGIACGWGHCLTALVGEREHEDGWFDGRLEERFRVREGVWDKREVVDWLNQSVAGQVVDIK